MQPDAQTPSPNAPGGIVTRILIPLGILGAGWLGFSLLAVEKEKVKKPQPPGRVLKTRVLELRRGDYQTVIHTQGVIRPHSEAALTPQVSGKVKRVALGLQDGAFFEVGEVLLELDNEDSLTDVIAAEAQLARADALHAQERAKANQARLNWDDLGYDDEPNDLVLRLPQLREAEANVKAAQAGLDRAKRDLARCVILAPFDGRVLRRSVAVGQTVSPGTELATIYHTAFVEVRLPIAARELAFLTLPEGGGQPPLDVLLSDALDPNSTARWSAKIIGTEGALDPNSRELFAIARIDDPFSRTLPPAERTHPLRIGQPVRAAIEGKILANVFAIPRDAVRQLNRIYLVDREKSVLDRREIDPIWSDADFLVIRDPNIPDGALIATSRLVYAPNVSKVEILPDADADVEADVIDLTQPAPDR